MSGLRTRAHGTLLAHACVALLACACAVLLVPRAARAQAAESSPPLDISADNMTGSRGAEGDIVLLNGNVRILRGRTVITSDHGRYLRGMGMLYLEQSVRLIDSTTTMTCDQASYSEITDVIRLNGRVVVVDGDATLHAPEASYDRRRGRV